MAVILNEKSVTVKTQRSVSDFTVTIPDDGSPAYATVVFVQIDKDSEGKVLSKRQDRVLTIPQSRLAEILPGFGLPSFSDMYVGLSQLFHAEYGAEND